MASRSRSPAMMASRSSLARAMASSRIAVSGPCAGGHAGRWGFGLRAVCCARFRAVGRSCEHSWPVPPESHRNTLPTTWTNRTYWPPMQVLKTNGVTGNTEQALCACRPTPAPTSTPTHAPSPAPTSTPSPSPTPAPTSTYARICMRSELSNPLNGRDRQHLLLPCIITRAAESLHERSACFIFMSKPSECDRIFCSTQHLGCKCEFGHLRECC
jgi:hypothetical protein